MKATVQFGSKISIEIDEKNPIDVLHWAIALTQYPTTCNVCKGKEIKPTTNKDKEGNTYINIKCKECGARSKMGQYKTGGVFWHDFEKYVPKSEGETNE